MYSIQEMLFPFQGKRIIIIYIYRKGIIIIYIYIYI